MEGQEACRLPEDAALAAAGPAGGAGVRVRREPNVAGLGGRCIDQVVPLRIGWITRRPSEARANDAEGSP